MSQGVECYSVFLRPLGLRLPSLSLVHQRHARREQPRTVLLERLRLSAPLRPVSPAAGSMPPDSPQASLHRPERDARTGLSLARNGCPSQSLHSGVNAPGLTLGFHLQALPWPVRLAAPLPGSGVAPLPGGFSAAGPLPASCLSAPCLPSGLHFPSGILPPSGSQRSAGLLQGRPLPGPPDLPSLPAAVFFYDSGYGSPFQVRYVPVCLLFLKKSEAKRS